MKLARRTTFALTTLALGTAQAHPGHDAPSALHWHAFDTWGWALALAAAAGAWWWARRK